MPEDRTDRIRKLLDDTAGGDVRSVDEVVALVYDELRVVAAHHLHLERPDHTLQPTALVHEA